MARPAASSSPVYRPRRPRESPLWRLLDRHFNDFRRVYEERYQKRYGFWRPVIATTVEKFLACGDLKEGFARVRCPTCRFEFLVAFSCRRRCLCPSCHQKRALVIAGHVARNVCEPLPHREFVFTIPKRLRLFFRFDRRLLGALPRLAWQTVLEVSGAVLDRRDVVPGMVAAIHTFGVLLHFHPVTDGGFTSDGAFVPLPETEPEPFRSSRASAGGRRPSSARASRRVPRPPDDGLATLGLCGARGGDRRPATSRAANASCTTCSAVPSAWSASAASPRRATSSTGPTPSHAHSR